MASNNPQDYIDPIIRAIFQTGQNQLAFRQQAEDERVNKERKIADDEDRKIRQEQLKAQNELQQKGFELQQKQFDLTRTIAEIQNLQTAISSGAQPPKKRKLSDTGNPRLGPEVLQGVFGGEYDPGIFSTPQQRREVNIGDVISEVNARMSAAEPFQIRQDARQNASELQRLGQQQTFTADQNKQNREQELRIAQMRDKTDREIANLNAQVRMSSLADGNMYDPGVIESYINDVYVTGNTEESRVPQKLRDDLRRNLPQGWTPLTKKDQEMFDNIPMTKKLVDMVGLLADQGTGMGRVAAVTGLDIFGDAATTQREVDGLIGNISRIFGGEKGVLTQPDIVRMKKLAYSAFSTQKGNKKSAKDLDEFFKEKLSPHLNKYNPNQLDAIFSRRGIDPNDFIKRESNNSQEEEWERGPDGKLRRKSK